MLNKKRFIVLLAVLIIIYAAGYLFLTIAPLPAWLAAIWQRPLPDKVFKGAAWFRFAKDEELRGWEEKIFKGRVLYTVVGDQEDGYLSAYSNNSASGLLYWLSFDPKTHPMVNWRWKVIKFPDKKGGVNQEGEWVEKDDYAARFYVIFPRFPFTRVQCLEYVWDKEIPEGTVIENALFSNLKIIVAESGEKNLGRWVQEERNVYDDFRRTFGSRPGKAGAIAIMTDSDNTTSTAEAQYDDIKVGYEK
ncbi:MAG: DUF3047 domain-containing protein [Candidatus Omnitrophica bacterium]|nr:DUF3047 domain-containing protein [Candidatus Omnitrophota bacterium]